MHRLGARNDWDGKQWDPNRMAARRAKDLDDILGNALTDLKLDDVGPGRHRAASVLGNDMD